MTNSSIKSEVNFLWASIIIEEVYRLGVRFAVIAPGSRSTPLALALIRHQKIKTIVHYDERGAGFAALGWVKNERSVSMVLSTSGTAIAHFLPAIIEAKQSCLIFIILTADRPVDLIHVGANQAIEQNNIYQNYAVFYNICPTLELSFDYLLSQTDAAYYKSKTQYKPLHINCMFREPLFEKRWDTLNWIDYKSQFSPKVKQWVKTKMPFSPLLNSIQPITLDSQDYQFHSIINEQSNKSNSFDKILICIGEVPSNNIEEILWLLLHTHFPIYIEYQNSLLSQLTINQKKKINKRILHYGHWWLSDYHKDIDCIVHIGGKIISKNINSLFKKVSNISPITIHIGTGHDLIDPHCTLDLRLIYAHVKGLIKIINKISSNKFQYKNWYQRDKTFHKYIWNEKNNSAIKQLEIRFINLIFNHSMILNLNKDNYIQIHCFVSNSLPIRHYVQYAIKQINWKVFCNRGTSGIDGNIATFYGIVESALSNHNASKKEHHQCFIAVLGDLATLHDLNSLSLFEKLYKKLYENQNFIILFVINNQGGQIFNQLPVKDSIYSQSLFQARHKWNFSFIAKQFGLNYTVISTEKDLVKFINLFFVQPQEFLINKEKKMIQLVELKTFI